MVACKGRDVNFSNFRWGRYIPLGIFIILAVFLFRGLALDPRILPSQLIGKPLPSFSVTNLFNPKQELTQQNFSGKIALINVWASWCTSCEEEQALLVALAQQGIIIYGLDYKDTRVAALNWLKRFGNPYAIIGFDEKGTAGIELGVYGTPETYLLDSSGKIRYKHVGPLTPEIWREQFLPIIAKID